MRVYGDMENYMELPVMFFKKGLGLGWRLPGCLLAFPTKVCKILRAPTYQEASACIDIQKVC